MSVEENKAIVRRFWEEIFNGRNLDLIDELFAADHVQHGSGGRELNLEDMKQNLSMNFNAFPDLHVTIEDLFAEGDRVATRYIGRGTHKGEMMGIPPTGKQVTAMGLVISRILGGKFVETWDLMDQVGMLQQLGVMPPRGQSAT